MLSYTFINSNSQVSNQGPKGPLGFCTWSITIEINDHINDIKCLSDYFFEIKIVTLKEL